MDDRCRKICGTGKPRCFVGNVKQIECISDMVLNKVFGIKAVLEVTMPEEDRERVAENLSRALDGVDELINWVKFLQISHDLRTISALAQDEGTGGARKRGRKEARFPLPEVYRGYIVMEVRTGNSVMTVSLVNFSRSGIQFLSPEKIGVDSVLECRISARHTVKREVTFTLRVRHCDDHEGAAIVGGLIEDISDRASFNFFESIHELIRNATPCPIEPPGTE